MLIFCLIVDQLYKGDCKFAEMIGQKPSIVKLSLNKCPSGTTQSIKCIFMVLQRQKKPPLKADLGIYFQVLDVSVELAMRY